MYYATAGQQATQPSNPQQGGAGRSGTQAGTGGVGMGGPGSSYPTPGGLARGGPPGFGSRTADPNDFPALGATIHHQSSYAAPTASPGQPSQQQSQSSQQQQQQQQSMFHPGLAPPPPPPGLTGPATPQSTGTNGMLEQMRGEEFPALGAEKERMANYLRQAAPPSPPPTIPNGGSSHSASATPSTQPPHPAMSAMSTGVQDPYQQHGTGASSSLAQHPPEPVTHPIQQILSSPVDRWGIKALLYEIKTQLGKTDRGLMMFGEDLAELGLDANAEDPLYRTFVTPWQDPSQIHTSRIQEMFSIPQHYQFPPPNMAPKMVNLTEDTLFIAFYCSPQDMVQIESAAELYNRGWRYHIELQLWLTGPTLSGIEGQDPPASGSASTSSPRQPNWLRGPFVFFDPRTLQRDRMPDDFVINTNLLELTRSPAQLVGEMRGRGEEEGKVNGPSSSQGGFAAVSAR